MASNCTSKHGGKVLAAQVNLLDGRFRAPMIPNPDSPCHKAHVQPNRASSSCVQGTPLPDRIELRSRVCREVTQ